MPEFQTPSATDFAQIPDDRRLVVIQRNPTSGSGRIATELRIMIRKLRQAGFRVRLFANRDRFDAFVRNAPQDLRIRCLVGAGGDGTIGSLANRHSDFPIAILPMGTENLMARHLGIPKCGETAAKLIADGVTRRFDTAVANNQRFLLMASVGFDADVVSRLHAARTGNIRHMTYVKPILSSFLKYSFPRLTVYDAEGTRLAEGSHVIATNIPEYGFRMPFCPEADAHDGQLDIRVYRGTGPYATLWHAARTRLGWKDRSHELSRFRASDIEVRSESTGTTVQIDGDFAGPCPARITIAPSSMALVVRAPHQ